MSFPPQPAVHAEQRLKYACEECHSRKIRCYALPKSQAGTCTPCHINGRKCLFALKNKTGRPRRVTQQQSKTKATKSTSEEWDQSAIEWERRPEHLRRQSDSMGYDYSSIGRFTYLDDQLPPMGNRPNSFSPRISGPSTGLYNSNAPRRGDARHESPRTLDCDADCMSNTELPNFFHAEPLSNALSGSSSEMSQDYFSMDLMASAPDSAPLLSATVSTDASSAGSSSYGDSIADTASYNQAFSTSQQIHHRFLQIQSQTFDTANKYASAEVCQTLESFDMLAKFLKQRIAGHKQHPHSGGLPSMIISGALYVAVLQAILIATVLLQSDNDGSASEGSSEGSQRGRRASSAGDQSMRRTLDTMQSIGNLDCILNLTKMEYYITVFNQYLQLFFCANSADSRDQAPIPVFDYKACIDTTESVQNRVRLLLSQSRQSML